MVILPLTVEHRVDGQPLAVRQTVPLWSLNENTGVWRQEADGMVIDRVEAPTGMAFREGYLIFPGGWQPTHLSLMRALRPAAGFFR